MRLSNAPRTSRIGLACAGGVVEGAIYEVGALCALDESIAGEDLHALDTYVGVSSGALLGSLLANGVSPRTMSRAVVSEADDPTLNLDPSSLFAPAFREYAGRLGRLPTTLARAVGHYALHPGDLSLLGVLSTFGSMVPTGFFHNKALARFLARTFRQAGRTNDFRRLAADLRVVAMHLDSAEVAVFGAPGYDHVPISKAVQASTALPGLYCPVEIDGEHYIDGVARRTVHASVALDNDVDLLFCINPIVPVNLQLEQHAKRLFEQHRIVDHGLPAVLSQTFRAIVDSRKTTGFKRYAHTHPDADLVLIEPDCEDSSLFFSNIFSFSNRHDVCEHAYQATRAYLRAHADTIDAKLRRHGLYLRPSVLDDPSRTLYPARQALGQRRHRVMHETDQVLERLDRVLDRIERTAA
ncbi:patatin-like phospholipase family protein [Salisaeta longa]|uniref:patatin-like phospholipase family protein n=1 Tax=Salisaeta longa TaxID=503170 RepID=UPI0003B61C34|nr:patatin-like phospholipase family protein [Salisaeta longa]